MLLCDNISVVFTYNSGKILSLDIIHWARHTDVSKVIIPIDAYFTSVLFHPVAVQLLHCRLKYSPIQCHLIMYSLLEDVYLSPNLPQPRYMCG